MKCQSIKFILALLLLSPSYYASAKIPSKLVLPKTANVPGGVMVIALELAINIPPQVFYQDKRCLVMRDANGDWVAIVGIPLDAKTGRHEVKIQAANKIINKEFYIQAKNYPTQHLKFADTRKTLPKLEDQSIIEQQYLQTIAAYAHWADAPVKSILLDLPVKGKKSSNFGVQRTVNNVAQNPHSGLDIAAPKGTPVKTAKDGTIINVGNYFYSGKIIFIDHGQGFITSYCHLDRILVKIGEKVRLGQVIGTVGNTGRATGPHLHWSVSLNGVRVDPELFIYG